MDSTKLQVYFDTIPWWSKVYSAVGMSAAAYHGYKRNNSVGWALLWGGFGAISPILTNVIAYAEGFGEPKKG